MGYKKPTKGFIVTVVTVLSLGGVWGVTHAIDNEFLTKYVYYISIAIILIGITLFFYNQFKKK